MKLQEIRDAVDHGKVVNWLDSRYYVKKQDGVYKVGSTRSGFAVNLSYIEGGVEKTSLPLRQFYIAD